jgi:hypothetical protein
MRKIGKICALVVVGMFVCMMLTPSVMAPPEEENELPFWGTEGNVAGKKDVLGTTNERDLKIITNGEQRMVITSEGNVGIGTTSPSGELEVVGNIVVSGTVDGVDIDVEVDALHDADIALQANIDAEEAARIAADDDLQDAIDAEEAARIAADNELQNQIDKLSSPNQLTQDFVVADGESITAGDVVGFNNFGNVQKWDLGTNIGYGSEYVSNSGLTHHISVAKLSSTKFVMAYQDADNSYYGTAVIGVVSGNTITFGSEYVFNSDSTAWISVVALSSDKFAVIYQDGGNSYYGTAVIGDVSGTTITYGLEYVFDSTTTAYVSATALSSNKFVVAYQDEDNFKYGTAVIGDVSEDVISFGSEYMFNSCWTQYTSIATLSSDTFVVAYQDLTNNGNGKAVIGICFGKIIIFGSEYVFESIYSATEISVAALSSSKFVVAYSDNFNSYACTGVIGDVYGRIIIFGSEYVFSENEWASGSISAAALSSDKFVVTYEGRGSHLGTAFIGGVSGNTITFGSQYRFNSAETRFVSAAALSLNKFVVAYKDNGNSGYGTTVIGEVSIGIPASSPIVGIAKESKTAGQIVPVIIGGVSNVHIVGSGMIYYVDGSGRITWEVTPHKIGLSISNTEILLATPFF